MANPLYTTGKTVAKSALSEALQKAEGSNAGTVWKKAKKVIEEVEQDLGTALSSDAQKKIVEDLEKGTGVPDATIRAKLRTQSGEGAVIEAQNATTNKKMDNLVDLLESPEQKQSKTVKQKMGTLVDEIEARNAEYETTPEKPFEGIDTSDLEPEEIPAKLPDEELDSELNSLQLGGEGAGVEGADLSGGMSVKGDAGPSKGRRGIKAALGIGGAGAYGGSQSGENTDTPLGATPLDSSEITEGVEAGKKDVVVEASDRAAAKTIQVLLNKGWGPPGEAKKEIPPSLLLQATPTPQYLGKGEQLGVPKELTDGLTALEGEAKRYSDLATEQGDASYTDSLTREDQDLLRSWSERKKELSDMYKERKDRLGTAQALSMFGTALAKLAAGLYGIRTGVNMSGVQFDMYDWSKDFDRAMDEYKLESSDLEQEVEAGQKEVDTRRKGYTALTERLDAQRNRVGEARQSSERFNIDQENQRRQENTRIANEYNKFDIGRMDSKAKAEYEAALEKQKNEGKASPADAMAEKMSMSMFDKDYKDVLAAQEKYSTGLAKLTEAADKGDKVLMRQAIDEVSGFLADPAAFSTLKEDSTKWNLTEATEIKDRLIPALKAEPKKQMPNPVDYMPGGSKYPRVQELSSAATTEQPAPSSPGPGASSTPNEVVITKPGQQPRKTTPEIAKQLEAKGWKIQE